MSGTSGPTLPVPFGFYDPESRSLKTSRTNLRVGFDTVLRDLADLGFDAEWCVVRADEVGAPHQRRRLFFLAAAADTADLGHEWGGSTRGRRIGPADHSVPAADTPGLGWGEGRAEPAGQQGRPGVALGGGAALADTRSNGLDGHGELPAGRDTVRAGLRADTAGRRTPVAANAHGIGRGPEQRDVPAWQSDADWGRFTPAITRWEATTGRRAPWATDDRRRLNPAFVEWMMGLPAGHVTDVPGLTRTQQLKALGNGVVPQQAAAAIRLLADRAGVAA